MQSSPLCAGLGAQTSSQLLCNLASEAHALGNCPSSSSNSLIDRAQGATRSQFMAGSCEQHRAGFSKTQFSSELVVWVCSELHQERGGCKPRPLVGLWWSWTARGGCAVPGLPSPAGWPQSCGGHCSSPGSSRPPKSSTRGHLVLLFPSRERRWAVSAVKGVMNKPCVTPPTSHSAALGCAVHLCWVGSKDRIFSHPALISCVCVCCSFLQHFFPLSQQNPRTGKEHCWIQTWDEGPLYKKSLYSKNPIPGAK